MPPLNSFSRTCLALAIGQVVAAPVSQAATIIVNSNGDSSTVDSFCTLREAVVSSNKNVDSGSGCIKGSSGLDTITFDSSLTEVSLTKANDIEITEDVNIIGTGASNLTINGMGNARIFRVNETDVSIESITLTGGSVGPRTSPDPFYAGDGGAILVTGGNLTLTDTVVTGNYSAGSGGGISLYGTTASLRPSNAQLNSSTVDSNSANNSGGGIGGAYSVIEVIDSAITGNAASSGAGISNRYGTITIRNSTLSGNSGGNGGAIYHTGVEAATALTEVLDQSRLLNNSAGYGAGAFQNGGRMLFEDCVISNNIASRSAGGLSFQSNSGGITMTNCSVSGNASGTYGGGGLLIATDNTISITNSVISENSSFEDGAGLRAYLSGASLDGVMNILNSTVSGNTIVGGDGDGGGMYISQGTATISNSTISNNFSGEDGGGIALRQTDAQIIQTTVNANYAVGAGAGVFTYGGEGSVTILNSIIANSQNSADCFTSTTPITAYESSIIEDGSCGTDARAVDPLLGPLANNGGPTQTHLLMNDSPAINAGDVSVCANPILARKDQRGVSHIDTCDIGSYESPVSETSFFVVPLPNGKTVIFGL